MELCCQEYCGDFLSKLITVLFTVLPLNCFTLISVKNRNDNFFSAFTLSKLVNFICLPHNKSSKTFSASVEKTILISTKKRLDYNEPIFFVTLSIYCQDVRAQHS